MRARRGHRDSSADRPGRSRQARRRSPDAEPTDGEEVLVPWGACVEVRGTVQEVYGPSTRRPVVVRLTPDLTASVVDAPTRPLRCRWR